MTLDLILAALDLKGRGSELRRKSPAIKIGFSR
jgi:hypothetical protein